MGTNHRRGEITIHVLRFTPTQPAAIMPNLVLFTGNANPELARKVANDPEGFVKRGLPAAE